MSELIRWLLEDQRWFHRVPAFLTCCMITVAAVYAVYDYVLRKLMVLQELAYRQGFEDGRRTYEAEATGASKETTGIRRAETARRGVDSVHAKVTRTFVADDPGRHAV